MKVKLTQPDFCLVGVVAIGFLAGTFAGNGIGDGIITALTVMVIWLARCLLDKVSCRLKSAKLRDRP